MIKAWVDLAWTEYNLWVVERDFKKLKKMLSEYSFIISLIFSLAVSSGKSQTLVIRIFPNSSKIS